MKFLKSIWVLVSVVQIMVTYAAELNDISCSFTYGGQAMNADNILQFSPKAPAELEQKVESFFQVRPELVSIFTGLAYYDKLQNGKAPYAFNFGGPLDLHMRAFLDGMYFSLQRSNAGISIPEGQQRYNRVLSNFTAFIGNDWVIKSSGFLNRRANILHEMGQDNRDPELPQAKLDQFIAQQGKNTYQTVSRMPYWLMVKEAIEKFKLDRIALPKMYLVRMPGRPAVVNDSNYVIVEENTGGRQLDKATDLLDPELNRQYEIAVKYADLWDNSEPNFRIKDGVIYPVDTEQPNNQRPSNFFWKDRAQAKN